jgi:hypothetical protein
VEIGSRATLKGRENRLVMERRKNNRMLLVVILSTKVVSNKGKKMGWELIHGETIFHNTQAILQMDNSMAKVG